MPAALGQVHRITVLPSGLQMYGKVQLNPTTELARSRHFLQNHASTTFARFRQTPGALGLPHKSNHPSEPNFAFRTDRSRLLILRESLINGFERVSIQLSESKRTL